MGHLWRIQLFGTLQAQQGEYVLHRFHTQKTGLLLAYLAYFSHRSHPREALIEMLWPEVELTTGRNRFKQALSSLRRQFITTPSSTDDVFYADRANAGVYPDRIITDVSEFQHLLRQSGQAATGAEKKALLSQAVALYQGDLLEGFYEDWVLTERQRLSESCLGALQQLIALCREAQEWEQALDFARRALPLDPWREEAYADIMRLYREMGRSAEALRQYETWERLLRQEWDAAPSEALRLLAQQLRAEVAVSLPAAPLPEKAAIPAERFTPPEPMAPAPLSAGPSPSLPVSLTRFFGREDEINLLESLLLPLPHPGSASNDRLITLLGPGGTGKTRLALEISRRLAQPLSGRIWFLPLADIMQADLLPGAMIETLSLRGSPTLDPLAQVIAFFQRPEVSGTAETPPPLIVMDNFEHLVEEGAPIVATLLREIPKLVCLVTSRHPLNIEGEREVALQPLPLPSLSDTPARSWEAPSVKLFVDRARARRADFALTPQNAASIVALCHRLEGIPLALELAAGWARTLTPAQMLERLEQNPHLLTSHRKDIHPRHASLGAAVEWSFRLLSPELQECFTQLSIFRGGWTLEAAEAVCEHPQTLKHLDHLGEHSLLFTIEQAGHMRYYLLETLRQYGEDKLHASGKADIISRRHRDYYLALLEGKEEMEKRREHDNLRVALDRSLAQPGDQEICLRFVSEMSRLWGGAGFWEEGRRYIQRLLDADLTPEQRAQTLHFAAIVALKQGDLLTARTLGEESLAVWQARGDAHHIARMLSLLASVCDSQGDYPKAATLYKQSLHIYEESEDAEPFLAGTLHNLGCVEQARGDFAAAQDYQEQSLTIYRRLEHPGGIPLCLGFLGDLARLQGDYARAWKLLEESVLLFRKNDEKPRVVEMLVRLAAVAERQGELETAKVLLTESLPSLAELKDRPNVARALQVAARVAAAEREYVRAARLYGSAEALREEMQMPLPQGEYRQEEEDRAVLLQTLGESLFITHLHAGGRLSWTQAVQYALLEG